MGQKYYAVQTGRTTGVFDNWSDAQDATKGYSGAVHKSFSTPGEAYAFANSGSSSDGGGSRASTSLASDHYSSRSTDIVYTDGSSRGNGRSGATGGYGVYYGEGDERNYSGRLIGPVQTNQRAELTGLDHALRNAQQSNRDITIYTDSEYSRNAVTKWGDNWDRNGYKTANGGDVANRDLIQSARRRIDDLKSRNINVKIERVPGHSGNPGNDAADRLANQGATWR